MEKIMDFVNKERYANINLGIVEIKLTYTGTFLIDLVCKIDLAIIAALLLVQILYK